MKKIILTANKRSLTGRKVKQLRSRAILPANLFGKGIASISIELPYKDFNEAYEQAGETNIINLTLDKKEHPVLVSNVQQHPVDGEVLHVDFHEINLKEKVTATVPIELEGESPAVKQGIGNLVQQLNELEVEALPLDLPEKLIADVSVLTEIDQAVLVKNLKYDKSKVDIEAGADEIVAKIEEPQKEEVAEPVVAEEVPAEADGQASKEGEQAAEGEAPKEE